MSDPGRQGLTVLLPVLPGAEAEIRAVLARTANSFAKAFARSDAIHFARFVLLPPGDGASPTSTLLFETTFDGGLEAHLDELTRFAGPELTEVLAQCEGFRSDGGVRELGEALRKGRFALAAELGLDSGRSAGRIREEARLHREVLTVLARDRALLGERNAPEIVEHVRREVGRALRRVPEGKGDEALEGSPSRGRVFGLDAFFALVWVFVTTLIADFLDVLARLWHDGGDASQGALVRPPRASRSDPALERPVQRAYTHVVALKPGASRRRSLRRVLSLLSRENAGTRVLGAGLHGARFVLTADGRLLFTAQHDGSPSARLAELALAERMFMLLLWASTRAIPELASSVRSYLGGGARLRTWASSYEVMPELAYSAYPMLTVADLGRNAELSRLLASAPTADRAKRLLELV